MKWKILSILLVCLSLILINYLGENKIEQSKIQFATVSYLADSFQAAGVVKPMKEWAIKANESGSIENVYSLLGEEVDKGQILFSIENEELLRTLNTQEIELETLKLEKAFNEQEINNLIIKKNKVENRNKLKLKIAQAKLKANKTLLKQGVISQLKLAELEAELALLEFEIEQSLKDIENKHALANHAKKITALKIQLSQNKLTNIAKKISASSIKAPENGFIAELLVTEGEYAEKGKKLAVINNREHMNLTAFVPANRIVGIKIGDMVNVHSPLGEVKASITSVSPVVKHGVVEVNAKFITSDDWLRPELQVEVYFSAKKDVVLAVKKPESLSSNSVSNIYVLDRKTNSLTSKEVSFGRILTDNLIEVKQGLAEHDVIVSSSLLPLNKKQYVLI